MRLVGASNFAIQFPFILEGLVAAIAGGVLAIVTTSFLVDTFLTESLASTLTFVSFVTTSDVLAITPYVLGLGAILAVLASGISTYRHIRI